MSTVFGGMTLPSDAYRLPRQVGQITFTDSTDDPDTDSEPLSTQIIRENPRFGAECFLKLLGQEQADRQLAYALMLEGLYGNFAVSGETYYMEYNYKLFRWKPGDTRWSDTGVQETCELTRENMAQRFKIAVSGETVYVGKRMGRGGGRGDSYNRLMVGIVGTTGHQICRYLLRISIKLSLPTQRFMSRPTEAFSVQKMASLGIQSPVKREKASSLRR